MSQDKGQPILVKCLLKFKANNIRHNEKFGEKNIMIRLTAIQMRIIIWYPQSEAQLDIVKWLKITENQ